MSQVLSDYLRRQAMRREKIDEIQEDKREPWKRTDKQSKYQDMAATYLSKEFLAETEKRKEQTNAGT